MKRVFRTLDIFLFKLEDEDCIQRGDILPPHPDLKCRGGEAKSTLFCRFFCLITAGKRDELTDGRTLV